MNIHVCLFVFYRLRRRERNLWADTPIAKLFTPQSGKTKTN